MSDCDIWVDFNDVDRLGCTMTLTDLAKPDVDLSIGASVLAGDFDGMMCDATVRNVSEGVVALSLDLGSVRHSPAYQGAGSNPRQR